MAISIRPLTETNWTMMITSRENRVTSSQEDSPYTAWTKDLPFVAGITFLNSIGVQFQSSGLYMLLKVKKIQRDNMVAYTNKILLILLSCTELSSGIASVTIYILILSGIKWGRVEVAIPGGIILVSSGQNHAATYLPT